MSFFDVQEPVGPTCFKPEIHTKYQWAELVGNHYLEVVQIIQREAPLSSVIPIPIGSPVTSDFRTDRIRVFYHKLSGIVCHIPSRG